MCTVVNRNTIVTVFGYVFGNIARALSTYRACEVGVVTEAIFLVQIEKTIIIVLIDKKKRVRLAMASLCNGKTSLWNRYVAFRKPVCKYCVIKNVFSRFRFSHSAYVYKQSYHLY